MKTLIISYHFGLESNVASQRWMQYSSFLKSKGWNVSVISGTSLKDPLYRGAQQKTQSSENSRRRRRLFPAFLFIDRQFLWSLKIFLQLITDREYKKIPIIVVSGAPWSGVVAVTLAAQITKQKLVIDFRDLWSAEPSLTFKTRIQRSYFKFLERWALEKALLNITVNSQLSEYYQKAKTKKKALELPNGFEGSLSWTAKDFNSIQTQEKNILYGGTVSNYHGLSSFLELYKNSKQVPLVFLGTDPFNILEGTPVQRINALPFSQALSKMSRAGVLLLTLAQESKHFITGKLMTYIKAGRPILYFGPENSPAAKLIRNNDIGWIVNSEKPDNLSEVLSKIASHFENGIPFSFSPKIENLENFSTDRLGERLVTAMELL